MSATFLRSSSRSRWIGFLPTTPVTRPLARVEHDALADEDLRVPAADLAEPQVAVVVDVRDDQPDLVDVPHHEQPPRRAARSRASAPRAPAACRPRRCSTSANAPAASRHTRGGRGLVAGRAARGEQVAQQRRHARGRAARGVCAGALRGAGLIRRAALAGRTGGCRRGGSTRPRAACRCARARRTRPARRRRARRAPAPRAARLPPSAIASARPVIENVSSPLSPSDCGALARRGTAAAARPCRPGSSGGCARSSAAITARTPSSLVPLAAQSREEPEPYSLPASTTSSMPSPM